MQSKQELRQIVLDIETTGIDPMEGHRVIELAAVELVDRHITGRAFHMCIDPGRDIDAGATAVHGITNDQLMGEPSFSDIADAFLEFIGKAELIAHNASFDIKFLNQELELAGLDHLDETCPKITDTLQMARTLRPDQRNNLSQLCKDYGIQAMVKGLNGALLDAHLTAKIYLLISQKFLH